MSNEYFERQILSYLVNFVSVYKSRPKLLRKFLTAVDEVNIGGVQVLVVDSHDSYDHDPDSENPKEKFKVYTDGDIPDDEWNFSTYEDALISRRDQIDNKTETPNNIKNLKTIASKYRLDELDARILELALVCGQVGIDKPLISFANFQTNAANYFIAGALRADFNEVSQRLSSRGALFKSGLLVPSTKFVTNSFFDISISPRIVNAIQGNVKSVEEVTQSFMGTIAPRKLTKDNYPNFEEDIKIIIGIVRNALEMDKGADILFTGVHGSGKTQLVLVLCEELGLHPAQIGRQAIDEGRDLDRAEMFADFLLLQGMVQFFGKSTVLFIDECERIFSAQYTTQGTTNKAVLGTRIDAKITINFWACNDTGEADMAFLRRMDHIVDFDIPPIAIRKSIIAQSCKNCGVSLTARQLLSLSRLKIAPSLIDTAINGAAVAEGVEDEKYLHILRIVNAFAPKLYRESYEAKGSIPENFNPDPELFGFQGNRMPSWVTKLDRKQIDGKSLTFLVAGPQGAGKTELARFMGEKLDIDTQEYDFSHFLPSRDVTTSIQIRRTLESAKRNDNLLVIRAPLADALKYESILQELTQRSRDWAIPVYIEVQCNPDEFDRIPKIGVTFAAILSKLQGAKMNEAFTYFFGGPTGIAAADIADDEGLVIGELKLAAERLKLLGIEKPSREDLIEALLSGQEPKRRIGFQPYGTREASERPALRG